MTVSAARPVDRSIRLPADLAGMLEEEAALTDTTRGTIVRQALRAFLTAKRAERAAAQDAATGQLERKSA